eukprot:TRINITY_DN3663_c0_g1_i2.p1 TRINITY_DN3663_c0_g1~~TRINITY_DN3663_c0_g1_i2.p1  ORF type:complete len:339 (+),score=50.02 TRINITY_DN3663_c0_g1_i2:289-1305(+)
MRSVKALRCILACPEEDRLKLAHRFYSAYWVEHLDITDDNVLLNILSSSYLSPQILELSQSERIKNELHQRTSDGVAKGIFGVPTFFYRNDMFYGQDKIEDLEERITDKLHPNRPLPYKSYGGFTQPVDFYFDYSSPYTYIASKRIESLFGPQNINWKPFLLGGLFKIVGTNNTPATSMHPNKQKYNPIDLGRQVESAGIPFRWTDFFPLRTVLALRVTIAIGSGKDTKSRNFIHRIFDICWVENKDPSDVEVIKQVLKECGYDSDTVLQKANSEEIKKELFNVTERAGALGLFGAPSFVFGTEGGKVSIFWGNDRLELALSAARGNIKLLGHQNANL